MRTSKRLSMFAAAVLVLGTGLGWTANEDTGTIVVQVEDLKTDDGVLRFVLFGSKKDFLKRPLRAEVIEISEQKGTWTVADLPFGTYAVLVHHDLNANGKMERHWYGKPKEPTGTSNNPRARMGPPLWKKASFDLSSPTQTITIEIK